MASTVSEEGTHGFYLTGSVNPSNQQFAVDYEFTQNAGVRLTRAVYEGLSVRAVSPARNVKFLKSQLCNTWHFDVRDDGSSAHFAGPLFYYGTADSWASVSNNETVIGDTWNWSPAWSDISSWIGFGARDYGTNVRTDLKVLSMTDESLQIAILRDNDPCLLSLNYAADLVYAGVSVNLLAVGSDWGGTWGSPLAMLSPQDIEGTHTVTYYGAVNGAMVTLLDFVGLKQRFPNAFVRIDDIKLDGQSMKFDANKFFYGDIEDNGNFRVEMFNIWGKGSADGNVVASPFSDQTNVGSDAAFTFAESVEITFTVVLNGVGSTYLPTFITINPSWGGPWDYNEGATFDVVLNSATAKYEVTQPSFDITYNSTEHGDGSIMTFVQINDIRKLFPSMHATLDELKLDGNSVSFDQAAVIDSNEGDSYRLELWNM